MRPGLRFRPTAALAVVGALLCMAAFSQTLAEMAVHLLTGGLL